MDFLNYIIMTSWYIDNAVERAAQNKNFHIPSPEAIEKICVDDYVRLQIFFVRKHRGEEFVNFSRDWVQVIEVLHNGSYVGILAEDSEYCRTLKENFVIRFTGSQVIGIDNDKQVAEKK